MIFFAWARTIVVSNPQLLLQLARRATCNVRVQLWVHSGFVWAVPQCVTFVKQRTLIMVRALVQHTNTNPINKKVNVTPFRRKVYDALLLVPAGYVTTYKDLAEYLDCGSTQGKQ